MKPVPANVLKHTNGAKGDYAAAIRVRAFVRGQVV
jgi:hypothetical protein